MIELYEIPAAYREFDASESEETLETEGYKPFWLTPRKIVSEKLPATVRPSSMDEMPGTKVTNSKDLGMRLGVSGTPEMDQLGLSLHKLVAAEIVNPFHKNALLTAERLFDSHGVGENLDP